MSSSIMATSAFLPVPFRAFRQCSRLLGGGTRGSLSLSAGLGRGFRGYGIQRSIVTLAGCSSPFKNRLPGTYSRMQILGHQKRWSANKGPEEQREQTLKIEPETTKSKILSKVPRRTREDIYNIPNILTFSRLFAAPLVGYFLVHDHHAAALSLFAYAGITDLVDGHLARRWKLQTVIGTIIDPMADKLLMTIGVACLAVNGSIPVWLAVIILGRDVGLAISALYYRWISLPRPKTMARFWDFSLPSAEVIPTEISKINTALQLFLVGSAIAMPVLPETVLDAWHLREAMTAFQYLVAGTTIWSGLSYIFSRNAVKILSKEEVQKRIARAAAAGKKDSNNSS